MQMHTTLILYAQVLLQAVQLFLTTEAHHFILNIFVIQERVEYRLAFHIK